MSPANILKEFLVNYILKNNLDEALLKEIPKKWEKYGDFVLFDERTFSSNIWKNQEPEFWLNIAKILKCKRIALKNKIKNDSYRSPNVTILLGNDPWILHKDNFVTYTWNVEKSMFSAGNACEKIRIAKINCENEVVVDLFAGIGYFTLPFLVHSKASYVHACEWNPAAIEALKRNLKLNKMENKCTVHEGDSNFVCPRKVANRVNLGLIPSSKSHWRTACEALVDSGGVLHIHENVETKKDEIGCGNCVELFNKMKTDRTHNIFLNSDDVIVREGSICISWKHKQWFIKGIHILHSLQQILTELGKMETCCSIENVSYVKSYAPHVNHLVYDVKIVFGDPQNPKLDIHL